MQTSERICWRETSKYCPAGARVEPLWMVNGWIISNYTRPRQKAFNSVWNIQYCLLSSTSQVQGSAIQFVLAASSVFMRVFRSVSSIVLLRPIKLSDLIMLLIKLLHHSFIVCAFESGMSYCCMILMIHISIETEIVLNSTSFSWITIDN